MSLHPFLHHHAGYLPYKSAFKGVTWQHREGHWRAHVWASSLACTLGTLWMLWVHLEHFVVAVINLAALPAQPSAGPRLPQRAPCDLTLPCARSCCRW